MVDLIVDVKPQCVSSMQEVLSDGVNRTPEVGALAKDADSNRSWTAVVKTREVEQWRVARVVMEVESAQSAMVGARAEHS
jgi:hypothetical protein